MRTVFVLFAVFVSVSAHATMTLEFWHSMSGAKGELLKKLVETFNREPQNVGVREVKLQYAGTYIEGLNKLRSSLMAHRGPHIAQIFDIGTQVMVDSGATTPLEDFSANDPEFPNAELLPQIRSYYELKGKLQALPFATSNPILFYNADLFKRAGIAAPPKTFLELAAMSRKLTDKPNHIFGMTWPLHSWFFEEWLARQGVTFVDRENGRNGNAITANFTTPEALAIVRLWDGLVKEGSFANVGRGWDPAQQNFLAARAAMFITSTSEVFEIFRRAPFAVGTGPIPTQDPKRAGGTVLGGNALWILKEKPLEEQRAAYAFLKFMASKAAQRTWHTGTGYFPIRHDLIAELKKEGFYEKNPGAWTAIEQLRASPEIPATRGAVIGVFPEVREHLESALESVLANVATPEAALAKAKTKSEAALVRYHRLREAAARIPH